MQRSIRITAGIMMAAWLGACSEPATRTAGAPGSGAPGAGRDVQLAEPTSVDTPVASDLEVGRRVNAVAAQPRHVHVPQANDAGLQALVLAPRVVSGLQVVAEQQLETVPIPETQSHTIYLAPTGDMEAASPVHVTAGPSIGGEPLIGHDYGGSRGPSIIIRGGMGGVDDKCDLRPRGITGTAINRSVDMPGRGGYGQRGGRSGIR